MERTARAAHVAHQLLPEDLFVFVGAGASVSCPAGLPLFNWLRDEILRQLELRAYVPGDALSESDRVAVASGLAPEPFMSGLMAGGLPVEEWLGRILKGTPNAAHVAIAALARQGARVWTVNFDTLIEQAGGDLDVLAWPEHPVRPAHLIKPHGSLPGPLILGSEQVVTGLGDGWRRRLFTDVRGRVALFLGYSGRDLDFQPLWNEVLRDAREVHWFAQGASDAGSAVEQAERLLQDADRRGKLHFPEPAPPPAGVPAEAAPNASWDFVAWCEERGLVTVSRDLSRRLFEPVPVSYPPLPGERALARARILDELGDFGAARRVRFELLGQGPQRRDALTGLLEAAVTHGGGGIAALLRLGRLLPPVGKLGYWRERAQRKRLTALHRAARHEAVLRGTRRLGPEMLSTYLILRAAALRMLVSLDEAAELADEALRRARRESHAVRAAHAAFQKAIALLWAERVEEAARCLNDELVPAATVAANRWVAWAEFIGGCLSVRTRDEEEAFRRLDLSDRLFRAEALMDGAMSVGLARLAALRLRGDDQGFTDQTNRLSDERRRRGNGVRYYARRSDIAPEALTLQRAEFARLHSGRRAEAIDAYEQTTRSRYPLHAALGRLGLALAVAEPARRRAEAERAAEIGQRIGARLVVVRAHGVLADAQDADAEVFFC